MCEEYRVKERDFLAAIAEAYSQSVMKTDKPIILVGGNGGSASQADHLVGELIGRFDGINIPIPAISLSANTAVLTALANDYGYSHAYSLITRAFSSSGSLFIGLSTSGNSPNVEKAIYTAHKLKMVTFAITGNANSRIAKLADYSLNIIGTTQTVQERTLKVIHKIARVLKELEENYNV